jgi:hypothetical protein
LVSKGYQRLGLYTLWVEGKFSSRLNFLISFNWYNKKMKKKSM